MSDLILAVAKPTSALPADWALYIIGILIGVGSAICAAFWKMHRQAMGKFDAMIKGTSKLVMIETHLKESKYAEQRTQQNMERVNYQLENHVKVIDSLDGRLNILSKKVKCPERQ